MLKSFTCLRLVSENSTLAHANAVFPLTEEAKIEAIIDRTEALSVDYATARIYGAVIHQLESEGKRIPLNDIWIAALTMQHGCALLARDAHFARIDGLELIAL